MSLTASLALTAANEQQIVKSFRAARALTGPTAQKLLKLRLNNTGTLRDLVEAAVIRKAGPDRYFLDEVVWAGRRQLRWRTVWRVGLVVGTVAAAAAIYFGGK